MKYLICGLIILGLISISGCATPYGSLKYQAENDFKRAYRYWAQDEIKLGDIAYLQAKDTYVEILLLLNDELIKELDDELGKYSNKDKAKIVLNIVRVREKYNKEK